MNSTVYSRNYLFCFFTISSRIQLGSTVTDGLIRFVLPYIMMLAYPDHQIVTGLLAFNKKQGDRQLFRYLLSLAISFIGWIEWLTAFRVALVSTGPSR